MRLLQHAPVRGLDLRDGVADSFSVADNADMRVAGEVGKLDGYEELSASIVGGGTLQPYQIAYRDDELIAWDTSDRLYSWDETAQGWRLKGPWTICDLELSTIAPRLGDQVNATGAAIGDRYLVAWEAPDASSTPEIAYEVRDGDGATIAAGTVTTFAGSHAVGDACPIVRATTTHWAILYHDAGSGAGAMRVRFVAVASPDTVTSATLLHTYALAPTHNKHDMVASDGQFVAATFDTVAATPTAVVWTFTSGGGASNTFATTAGSDHLPAIAMALDETASFFTLFGLAADAQTLEGSRVELPGLTLIDDNTHTLDGTDTFSSLVADVLGSDVAYVLAGSSPVATLDWTRYVEVVTVDISATPSFAALDEIFNATVSHKPFELRNRMLAPILAQAELVQGTATLEEAQTSETYLVYDLDRREVVARFREGGQAARSTDRVVWPAVDLDGATAITVASHAVRLASGVATLGLSFFRDEGISYLTLDFTQQARPTAKVQGLLAMASAGMVRAYDGRDIFELDWHTLPVATVAMAGSGGSIGAGTYIYAVYWRWEDALGQLHQSAPALITRTAAANDEATITVYGEPHSGRSRVQVGIARTNANSTAEFRDLLTFADPWDAVPGGTVVYVDDDSDATIADSAFYEQAGTPSVKPHQATPAARFIAVLSDRLWFGDPEVPNLVHYAIACRDGFAPGITPAQVIGSCDGPAFNAIAELDGAFYAIGASGFQAWSGDGPGPLEGDLGGFSGVTTVPSTLGVSSQLLVARVPEGILYVSPNGPRLLGRDQASADPFGAIAPVFLDGTMTASRLLYVPAREESIVYSPETEVKPGPLSSHPARTMRFAHGTARWSSESGAQARTADVSADGDVVFLRTDTRVCRHTPGVYLRGAVRSQVALVSNDLTFGPDAQYTLSEVRVDGEFKSAHSLQVCFAYDGDDFFSDLVLVDTNQDAIRTPLADAATPPAWMRAGLGFEAQARKSGQGPVSSLTRYHYAIANQASGYSLRVALSDFTDAGTGTGESFTYRGLLVVADIVDAVPALLPDQLTF